MMILVVVAWIFSDNEYDSWWMVFPVLLLIGFGIFFSPVQDLAIDQDNFYFLESSPAIFLNKERAFKISRMKSITSASDVNASDDTGKYSTIIEMTFDDGSVQQLKVTMLSRDISEYIETVNQMISRQLAG